MPARKLNRLALRITPSWRKQYSVTIFQFNGAPRLAKAMFRPNCVVRTNNSSSYNFTVSDRVICGCKHRDSDNNRNENDNLWGPAHATSIDLNSLGVR